jgi:hypothetical protein
LFLVIALLVIDEDAVLEGQQFGPLKHAKECQEEQRHEDEVHGKASMRLAPSWNSKDEVDQENSHHVSEQFVVGRVPVNFSGGLRVFEPKEGKRSMKRGSGMIIPGSLPEQPKAFLLNVASVLLGFG